MLGKKVELSEEEISEIISSSIGNMYADLEGCVLNRQDEEFNKRVGDNIIKNVKQVKKYTEHSLPKEILNDLEERAKKIKEKKGDEQDYHIKIAFSICGKLKELG